MAFIVLERDAPTPPPVELIEQVAGGLPLGELFETMGHATRKKLDRTKTSIAEVLDHVRHPTRLAETGADVIDIASSLARQARSCLLYTSPSPRDRTRTRMPSSA
mgnify:CR=1 FL=1